MLSPGAEMWHRNVLPQGNNPEQSKLFWAGICKQTPLWQGHLLIISVTNFYLCLSVTHRMTAQSSGRPHVLNSRTAILFDILTYLVKKKQKRSKFCENYLLQVCLTNTILFTSFNQLCLSCSFKIHKVCKFSLRTLQDVRLYLENCFLSAINTGKKIPIIFKCSFFFYPTS